jgi:hypothetical protein
VEDEYPVTTRAAPGAWARIHSANWWMAVWPWGSSFHPAVVCFRTVPSRTTVAGSAGLLADSWRCAGSGSGAGASATAGAGDGAGTGAEGVTVLAAGVQPAMENRLTPASTKRFAGVHNVFMTYSSGCLELSINALAFEFSLIPEDSFDKQKLALRFKFALLLVRQHPLGDGLHLGFLALSWIRGPSSSGPPSASLRATAHGSRGCSNAEMGSGDLLAS